MQSARTAAALELRTVVVDGAEELGGLCILRGCMPSKTLIESANRFLTIRRAEEFGLKANAIGVDADAIIARKRKLIGEFADYRSGQLQDGRFDLVRATAQFVDAHTVEVTPIDGCCIPVSDRTRICHRHRLQNFCSTSRRAL